MIVFSKDHTPITRADLELFCEDEQADRSTWQSCEQVENGHGRLQRRHLLTSPDLNAYLRRDWGEVGQVFGLPRQRRSKDKHRLEVLYGWTRLAQKCCSPQRLLPFIRAHWAVENRLHWRRDVTDGGRMAVVCASRQWPTCLPCSTPLCSPYWICIEFLTWPANFGASPLTLSRLSTASATFEKPCLAYAGNTSHIHENRL